MKKIGTMVVMPARYAVFRMAEVAVPRDLFGRVLALIDSLRPRKPAPCLRPETPARVNGQAKCARRAGSCAKIALSPLVWPTDGAEMPGIVLLAG